MTNQAITDDERREQAEHQAILLDIQGVLATRPGRSFIKYLFKNFQVAELPGIGLPDEYLRDHLGALRTGNAIFNIVSQANAEMAGTILAQVQKEKHVQATISETRPS